MHVHYRFGLAKKVRAPSRHMTLRLGTLHTIIRLGALNWSRLVYALPRLWEGRLAFPGSGVLRTPDAIAANWLGSQLRLGKVDFRPVQLKRQDQRIQKIPYSKLFSWVPISVIPGNSCTYYFSCPYPSCFSRPKSCFANPSSNLCKHALNYENLCITY